MNAISRRRKAIVGTSHDAVNPRFQAAPGDQFEARFDADEDAIVFRRVVEVSDWLEVLKDCPTRMDDSPRGRRALPRHRKL